MGGGSIKKVKAAFKNVFMTVNLLKKCAAKYIYLLILISIFIGLATPGQLIIWKWVIDEIVNVISGDIEKVKNIVILLIIHFCVFSLTQYLYSVITYIKKISSEYLNKYISETLLDKVSQLDLIQFDDSSIYDDIKKVNDETVDRTMEFVEILTQFIKNVAQFCGTVSIFLTFNPLIILLCSCTSIPVFYINIRLFDKEFALYNSKLEDFRLVNALQSMFIKNENIKEMKIYSIVGYFKKLISNVYDEYISEDKSIRKGFLKTFAWVSGVENLITYLLKLYTIMISIFQKASIGSITMYLSTIDAFQGSVADILCTFSELYENKLYMESVFKVINLEPRYKCKDNIQKIKFPKCFKVIEFKNVWFKYPNKNDYALKNISFKLYSNRTYSIVGLNGSGKTTLIKLISMLYLPNKGDIYIDGINIKQYDRESVYRNIGVVFQDYVKFPLKVDENIAMGNIDELDDEDKIREAAEKAGASEFIENLPEKYKTRLQKEWKDGVDLSLGQWQKLAISRAFMADRSLLILDEPTASLDAEAEYEIFKSFKKLIEGKTCILISHRFSTVRLSDEIIVLKNGEIIEQGSHEKLCNSNGLYEKLYNMQSECYV